MNLAASNGLWSGDVDLVGNVNVAALASRWGHHGAACGGRTVWAEATWPVPVLTGK